MNEEYSPLPRLFAGIQFRNKKHKDILAMAIVREIDEQRRAARIAKETQAYLQAEEEKFTRRATARGLPLDKLSSAAKSRKAAAAAANGEEDDEAQNLKPVSPSTPVGTRMAPSRNKVDITAPSGIEGWVSRALGKR